MQRVALVALVYGLALVVVVKFGRAAVRNAQISKRTYYILLVAFAALAGILLRLLRHGFGSS